MTEAILNLIEDRDSLRRQLEAEKLSYYALRMQAADSLHLCRNKLLQASESVDDIIITLKDPPDIQRAVNELQNLSKWLMEQ